MYKDEALFLIIFIGMYLLGIFVGITSQPQIKVQKIREVENGYYITINDEIYYKGANIDE